MQKLHAAVVTALVVAVVAVAGCEGGGPIEPNNNEGEGEEGEGDVGEGEGEGEGDVGEGEGEGEGEGDGCDLDEDIVDDVVVPAACSPLIVTHDVTVTPGASLTFEAGLTVRFDDGVGLDVRGDLFAEGTADDGIVLESNEGGVAGSWRGVSVFTGVDDAVFSHVTFRHGGLLGDDLLAGCLTTDTIATGVLVVTDSEFADCAGAGFASFASTDFGAFEGNTFTRCPVGINVHGGSVGSIDVQTLVDTPRLVIGNAFVTRSATWVAQGAPWEVTLSPLLVTGAGTSLILEAQTLRIRDDAAVDIGDSASLTATGVDFEGIDGAAWGGIVCESSATSVVLNDVSVSDAEIALTVEADTDVVLIGGTFDGSAHDICVEDNADTVRFTGATGDVEDFPSCGL